MQQKQVKIAEHIARWQANTLLEDYDVVLIGGGVAGYVAAIKAGQEGMKVGKHYHMPWHFHELLLTTRHLGRMY